VACQLAVKIEEDEANEMPTMKSDDSLIGKGQL